jgi:DNA polymerase III sliding clamp (beta) subunit (PCNA family)
VLTAAGALGLAIETVRQRVQVTGPAISADDLQSTTAAGGPARAAAAVPGAPDLAVAARHIREGLRRVAFAADASGRRPHLHGVLFETGSDGLTLTATDGFRIARSVIPGSTYDADGSDPGRGGVRLVAPLQAVRELIRLLEDAGDEPAVRLARNTGDSADDVTVVVGDTALSFRPMDGHYPDVSKILPREWRTRAVVRTAELRSAAGATTLFGRTKPLLVEARAGSLALYAPDGGAGEIEIGLAAAVEGPPGRAVLSADLLLPVLDAASADSVELTFTSSLQPVAVRERGPHQQEAQTSTWVIQPMHAPNVLAHSFVGQWRAASRPTAA